MILKTFTSTNSPDKAIQSANEQIKKMELENYRAKEIAQSESAYYNSFLEAVEFHFTITILFIINDTD